MTNKLNRRKGLTRKEQRDLDIEIGFMRGVAKRDPRCSDALRVLSEDCARRGKFDEAHRANLELIRILPDNPEALYNLACSCSLVNDLKQSITALRRAISKGFDDFKWMMKDPDLSNLRKSPEFEQIWKKVSALQVR